LASLQNRTRGCCDERYSNKRERDEIRDHLFPNRNSTLAQFNAHVKLKDHLMNVILTELRSILSMAIYPLEAEVPAEIESPGKNEVVFPLTEDDFTVTTEATAE